MSANMQELQWMVVCECYCPWEVFMENVECSGWSRSQLQKAADECETKQDLKRLVNQFV